MKRRRLYTAELAVTLALLAGLLAGIAAGAAQPDTVWHDKLIRLHVVANSDSAADQAQKLEVRDAVLAATEPILQGAASAQEARQRLTAQLPLLTETANAVLQDSGMTATVTLQREVFPLREYETFSLPAGEYEALRVTIGDGAGHNWWCVVYPSLCFTASAEELTEVAVAAGLTEDEAAQLTGRLSGQRDGYVFRFRLLELWQKLWNYLFKR